MPKPKKKLILFILLVLILGLGIFFLINRTAVIDWFKGIGYNPTPAMVEIKESLGLTTNSERIFNATRPILASRDNFNESCESHNEAVSVLGCYTDDRVFVYNIDNDELDGIRESTAAHELLHAIWYRLSGLEKSNLIPVLEETYNNHPEMKETVESYPENEQLGEIYVRLATQIKKLPEALETHYAEYFTDQDSIVSYYDSYIAPFNELTEKINQLKAELETLEKEIDDRSSALSTRIDAFDKAVNDFNSCAETAGCFANDWVFQNRRSELVNEQLVLNTENALVNGLLEDYNKKAEEFNKYVVHSNELQDTINSNAPVKTIEE